MQILTPNFPFIALIYTVLFKKFLKGPSISDYVSRLFDQ